MVQGLGASWFRVCGRHGSGFGELWGLSLPPTCPTARKGPGLLRVELCQTKTAFADFFGTI